MADILSLVNQDEASFPLEIMGKKDGSAVKTGVTFYVRDLGNRDSQEAYRKIKHEVLGKRATGVDLTPEETGAYLAVGLDEPNDVMLAHCVTGWDWPEGSKFGKCDLNFSHKNVMAVFDAAPWLREQVRVKALSLVDFTEA